MKLGRVNSRNSILMTCRLLLSKRPVKHDYVIKSGWTYIDIINQLAETTWLGNFTLIVEWFHYV